MFISLLDLLLTNKVSQYSLFHWMREMFLRPLAMSHVQTDWLTWHQVLTPDPVPMTESVDLQRVSCGHIGITEILLAEGLGRHDIK